MTYVSHKSECALEGYQWCRGLCFVVIGISKGKCLLEILMQGRHTGHHQNSKPLEIYIYI